MWYGTALGTKSGMKTFNEIFKFSDSKEGKFRLKVIEHLAAYGLASAKSAFGVSRATIYRWRKIYKDNKNNQLFLIPQSRIPKHKRVPQTDYRIVQFIREIRQEHPRIGKEKIKPLLDEHCKSTGINSVSISTIGRVIRRKKFFFQRTGRIYHNPNSGFNSLKYCYKTRVKRSPKTTDPGYYELDTIQRFVNKTRIYVFNAVDIKTRFQFSYAYKNGSSISAKDFLHKLETVSPFKITKIQTDNGSEFQGEFSEYLHRKQVEQLYIYPRCPRINGYVERANRSLDEEFLRINLCYNDTDFRLKEFNAKLIEHLIWFNSKRVHKSLGNLSPLDFWIKSSNLSHMYWTHTMN